MALASTFTTEFLAVALAARDRNRGGRVKRIRLCALIKPFLAFAEITTRTLLFYARQIKVYARVPRTRAIQRTQIIPLDALVKVSTRLASTWPFAIRHSPRTAPLMNPPRRAAPSDLVRRNNKGPAQRDATAFSGSRTREPFRFLPAARSFFVLDAVLLPRSATANPLPQNQESPFTSLFIGDDGFDLDHAARYTRKGGQMSSTRARARGAWSCTHASAAKWP